LQTLTAAGLQLKLAASRPEPETKQILTKLRDLLLFEQRRLRSLVTVQRAAMAAAVTGVPLSSFMHQLTDRLQHVWGCVITLTASPRVGAMPAAAVPQLDFILAEAIANAVQHGRASQIDIEVDRDPKHLLLSIRDDGFGLAAGEHASRAAEARTQHGNPLSLRTRVNELDGSVALSDVGDGTVLKIRLPIGRGQTR
jgi:signal transduction histidine kinase